jgi:hypothetical protein
MSYVVVGCLLEKAVHACMCNISQPVDLRQSINKMPSGQDEQPSLSDLPDQVVALVAKRCAAESSAQGHPLRRVARCGRDAVLQGLTRICLNLSKDWKKDNFSPDGRLLDRACRASAAGLAVQLVLGNHCGALPKLLQPALDFGRGGWHNVHKLSIEPKYACSGYCGDSKVRQAGVVDQQTIRTPHPHISARQWLQHAV